MQPFPGGGIARGVDAAAHVVHVAQPALPHRLAHEVEAGIVAEHVAHLNDEFLLCGLIEDCFPLGEVRARRFIEMDVLTRRR